MFGIHFKHVLVLTLLAGIAYTLPQVRDGLSESFSSIYVQNQAALFNFPNNNFQNSYGNRMMNNQINTNISNEDFKRPPQAQVPAIGVGEMRKMMIVPEEIVRVLVKEGVIPQDKAVLAVKILKERLFNNQPMPPQQQGASTTRPNAIRVQYDTNRYYIKTFESQKSPSEIKENLVPSIQLDN